MLVPFRLFPTPSVPAPVRLQVTPVFTPAGAVHTAVKVAPWPGVMLLELVLNVTRIWA
jgi:hypothetical protein